MSNINAILHHTVIVADLQTALVFYCNALGLTQNPDRPDLGYPGAWLDVGHQQIHLMELPNPDPVAGRPDYGGRDRHVALAVDDFEQLKKTLSTAGITYTESRSGRVALFCRDPDGNALEFVAEPGRF